MISFLFVLLTGSASHAFPEMVRHHYVNCGACHVNANGGGVLNAYGRSLSSEVLSTWGRKNEERAFYSIDPEKVGAWLNVGGDVRGLQVYQDNAMIKRGRFFWMQGSIDLAATVKDITAFMTVGEVDTVKQIMTSKIPRYFVSYQPTDEISVRAGRYLPIYGLNIPQHQALIRQNLSLEPGMERYAADAQWNGENWNFLLGYSQLAPESYLHGEEKSFNSQVQMTINDSHKVGVSAWRGESDVDRKLMLGAQAVLGWTEKFYTLTEVDQVATTTKSTSVETKSIVEYLKLGYEFYKGVHFQVVQEFTRPDLSVASGETQIYGAGALWYPRPHFEFEGLWTKKRTFASTNEFEDYAYFLTHYYF